MVCWQVVNCIVHWHTAPELIVCLTGSFVFSTDGQEYTLQPGDLIYLNGSQIHSGRRLQEGSTLLTIQLAPELFEQDKDSVFNGLVPGILPETSRQSIVQAVQALTEQVIARPYRQFKVMARCFDLLDALSCAAGRSETADSVQTKKKPEDSSSADGLNLGSLRESILYLHEHFADPELSMEFMAGRARLSYHYFSRQFKQICGLNFKEYLTRLRVAQAREKLINTRMSVHDISASCGFSEPKQLIAAFGKYMGLRPLEYRKKVQQCTQNQTECSDSLMLCLDDAVQVPLSAELVHRLQELAQPRLQA